MGLTKSRLLEIFSLNKSEPQRILMLGLDAAGKTTVLMKMKMQEHIMTIPTIGFNVEEIKIPHTRTTMLVWDIGGQKRLRDLWKHYFLNTTGLIFIVDSADVERLEEAYEELSNVLDDSEMSGVPLVLFANKQDLPHAISAEVMYERMCLKEFQDRGHDCCLIPTVANTGEGIEQGIQSIADMSRMFIKKKRNND